MLDADVNAAIAQVQAVLSKEADAAKSWAD